MTYEEILEVLGQHEYSKRAFENSYGIVYDCECGERFVRRFDEEHSGHSEHLAAKLVEAEKKASEPKDVERPWTIWSEGYRATGECGDATYMGTEHARTFDEAVEKLRKHYPDARLFRKSDSGVWSYWACKLFDNEADARKTYG